MNINHVLDKHIYELTDNDLHLIISSLKERFLIESRKNDRSAIYAKTQTVMAYNSNKIEGSTLTPEQTASL